MERCSPDLSYSERLTPCLVEAYVHDQQDDCNSKQKTASSYGSLSLEIFIPQNLYSVRKLWDRSWLLNLPNEDGTHNETAA